MSFKTCHKFACLLMILPMAACGGGGSSAPQPENLVGAGLSAPTLRSTEINGTSVFSGVGFTIRSGNAVTNFSDALGSTDLSGSFNHGTQSALINDGNVEITLVPDLERSAIFTSDGLAADVTDSTLAASGVYNFVGVYQTDYTFFNDDVTGFGVGGFATDTNAIPTSGAISFSGDAAVIVGDTSNQNATGLVGTSAVAVDFARNTVSTTLNDFTATNLDTGASVTAPIDTLTITDMSLSGNQFSGGTLVSTLAGNAVNLAGVAPTLNAGGRLFGQDTDGNPDEIGGVFTLTDGNTLAMGFYVAD